MKKVLLSILLMSLSVISNAQGAQEDIGDYVYTLAKDNTTTLASSMLQMTETKLDIDYILVVVGDKYYLVHTATSVMYFFARLLYDQQ